MLTTADILIFIFATILAFVVTYLAIPSIVRVANKKHLFDDPDDDRRVHTVKTPSLGGVAIFAGISLSSLLFINLSLLPEIKYIIGAMIILFFIGIKDDILMIAPLTKLLGQIAASIVLVLGDLHITNLHNFLGLYEINSYIGIPLTIFSIIIITNALNFIDGIDGLAATITIIISSTFGIFFFLVEDYAYFTLSLIIIGSLLAFIRFNVFSKSKKIFMGDTGSLILGLLVAVLVIKFNEINAEIYTEIRANSYIEAPRDSFYIRPAPVVIFGILIIPLYDMLRVMYIRILKKKSVSNPDKNHIHHICLRFGLTHKKSVALIAFVNILFIAFSFLLAEHLSFLRLLLFLFIFATLLSWIISVIVKKKEKNKE